MKHVGQELFSLIDERKLVKKDIAKAVGISPVYMSQLMNKESMECTLLEKLCKVIGVSPAYFFDDYQGSKPLCGDVNNTAYLGGVANVNIYQTEVKLLKELLSEKERIIKILLDERESKRDKNETKG